MFLFLRKKIVSPKVSLTILVNFPDEARVVTGSDSKHSALLKLFKNEIDVAVNYVQSWPNR